MMSRQSTVHQCGYKGGRTRETGDSDSLLNAGPDQQKTGVRNSRCTRVCYQCNFFSCQNLLNQMGRYFVFVVLVIGTQWLMNLVMIE